MGMVKNKRGDRDRRHKAAVGANVHTNHTLTPTGCRIETGDSWVG